MISAVSSVPVGKTPGRLGVWLRQELTHRGYDLTRSQSRFAREVGVVPSIINRILNEDRGAENYILARIGAALGYTLGEMLVFSGQAEPGDLTVRSSAELQGVSDNPYTDPHERAIWQLPELSETVRRMLIVNLRAALHLEAEEDRRPDAEVRQFKRPS